MMRRKRFRGAAMLCIALALSAPTTALGGEQLDPNLGDEVLGASGGVRYRSDSMTFDGGSGYANAEVGCGGAGWHLLGGGSSAGGPTDQAWLQSSRPIDFTDPDDRGDDGWYSSGQGPGTAEITGYSVCIRDDAIRYRSKQVASSPSGLRSGSVGCGGARWHVTAGSSFIATTGSWTSSSSPIDGGDPNAEPDDGWRARVFDTVGGAGGFVVHAICTRGLDLRYVKRGPVSIPAGGSVVRSVGCKVKEHVAGGGARVSGPADAARLVATTPYDDGDVDDVPDDGWRSRVHNRSGLDEEVTAFAICLS
ncbi:MAG: hypothetical protein ACXWZF_09635 [Actinomycetota bacterium]